MPGSAPSAPFERGTGVRGDAPAASGARQLGAARLRGLTAALRPSFWHPSRSTAQWIAWNGLSRARDLPGIGGGGRSQFGHDLNLHVAVLQLPFIVLLEQYPMCGAAWGGPIRRR